MIDAGSDGNCVRCGEKVVSSFGCSKPGCRCSNCPERQGYVFNRWVKTLDEAWQPCSKCNKEKAL